MINIQGPDVSLDACIHETSWLFSRVALQNDQQSSILLHVEQLVKDVCQPRR